MLRTRFFAAAVLSFMASAAMPAFAQGMMKDDGMAKDQMSKDATPKTGCNDTMAKDAMAKEDCKDAMSKDGMTKDNMMAPTK